MINFIQGKIPKGKIEFSDIGRGDLPLHPEVLDGKALSHGFRECICGIFHGETIKESNQKRTPTIMHHTYPYLSDDYKYEESLDYWKTLVEMINDRGKLGYIIYNLILHEEGAPLIARRMEEIMRDLTANIQIVTTTAFKSDIEINHGAVNIYSTKKNTKLEIYSSFDEMKEE